MTKKLELIVILYTSCKGKRCLHNGTIMCGLWCSVCCDVYNCSLILVSVISIVPCNMNRLRNDLLC
uniref:Uncharacterized protein n=1 Tax=Rhizophora mucronata TaxID=61149 RepID=A0A2P2P1X1_RHIMU